MTQDDVIRLATQARLPHDYETQEPVWLDKLETFAKLVAEQSHLEAQKQEPVGRFSKFTDGVWREVTATSAGQPLYAAPPQRKPLTDEQIEEIGRNVIPPWIGVKVDSDISRFARAIEAAHGIKEKNTEQDGNCKHCVNGCSACDARRQPNVLS